MRNKVYWGLSVLIVLLIGAFVLVMVNQHAEIKQLEAEAKKAQDKENQMKDTPPVAREGFKMVPHGDHWHEVPIDAPDTWQGEEDSGYKPQDPRLDERGVLKISRLANRTPPPPTDRKVQTYFGPLTYHAELLETNPVQALRLQTIERGHWSKDFIPPFPPDDEEAQAYARTAYLKHYYRSIGEADNPLCKKAAAENYEMFRVFMSYPYGPRTMDLMRLSWPSRREFGKVTHASNYFNEYTGAIKDEYAHLLK